MNPAPTSEAPPDVDLQTTRRTFLFAREQVAANTRTERYAAARDMGRRAGHGGHAASDAHDTAPG
jgi:hypothetical protein